MSTSALLFAASLATAGPAPDAGPPDVPSAPSPSTEASSPAAVATAPPLSARTLAQAPVARGPAALTPGQAERLRAYQRQRLRVVDETELRGGTAAMSMAAPTPGPGRSSNVVVVDPFYTVHTWGVYAGDQRLSPTEFFRETGETFRADELDRRIERDQRKARRWMVVAGVGAASLAAGVVQYDRARDLPQQLLAQQLTFGGLGVGMTGLMAASFPATRAARVAHYPSAVVDRADAEELAARHNRVLQERLGLTEADLLLLELADRL